MTRKASVYRSRLKTYVNYWNREYEVVHEGRNIIEVWLAGEKQPFETFSAEFRDRVDNCIVMRFKELDNQVARTRKYTKRIDKISECKSRLRNIFSAAPTHKYSLDQIMELVRDQVWDTGLHKLTIADRALLRGYQEALYDQMWNYVEWVHVYDGEFLGPAKGNPKTANLFKDGFDQAKLRSYHAYKGTNIHYT